MDAKDVVDNRSCMFCTNEWCESSGKDTPWICANYFPYLMPWNNWGVQK